MKKIMCTVLVLALAILPACAQRSVTKAAKDARKKITQTTRKNTNTRIGTQVNRSAAEHAKRNVTTMRKGKEGTSTPTKGVAASASAAPKVPTAYRASAPAPKGPEEPSMKELEEYLQQTRAENKALALEEQQLMFQSSFGKSVLLAPFEAKGETGGFSVTVVQTHYQGKDEIFGIIATHALKENSVDVGLQQTFDVTIMVEDGTIKKIPAKVVQSAPVNMLDISLVKFDPQYESLLKPLELADKPAGQNEPILSPGFASLTPVLANRIVTQNSLISVRTNLIDVGNKDRDGFCGSPLLDTQQRVKAIHTGSAEEKSASYGTHATFINKLVEAYHNNGKATYDLVLDDHVLTTLNVDEYISGIAVLDEGFNVLFKDDGIGAKFEEQWKKYSENKLRNKLQEYTTDGKYLVLHSRTPFWVQEAGGSFSFAEDRTLATMEEGNLRVHLYDIESRQLLYSVGIEDMGSDVQSGLYFDLDGMTIEHGKVVERKENVNFSTNNEWIDY